MTDSFTSVSGASHGCRLLKEILLCHGCLPQQAQHLHLAAAASYQMWSACTILPKKEPHPHGHVSQPPQSPCSHGIARTQLPNANSLLSRTHNLHTWPYQIELNSGQLPSCYCKSCPGTVHYLRPCHPQQGQAFQQPPLHPQHAHHAAVKAQQYHKQLDQNRVQTLLLRSTPCLRHHGQNHPASKSICMLLKEHHAAGTVAGLKAG